MDNQIEAIRTALRDDADPLALRAGLAACREVLAKLETATDGEPPTPPNVAPASSPLPATPPPAPETSLAPAAPLIDPAAIATLVASIGKLPPEQLLDLAIARLRAALPQGASVSALAPVRFQLVPLHHLGRSK
jgi:hypothetical protein